MSTIASIGSNSMNNNNMANMIGTSQQQSSSPLGGSRYLDPSGKLGAFDGEDLDLDDEWPNMTDSQDSDNWASWDK